MHPTRTILHTGEDGPERLELIYDQYGGLEINLPVYRDGRTVRFLGLDEEHLLED